MHLQLREIINAVMLVLMVSALLAALSSIMRRTTKRCARKSILENVNLHGDRVVFPEQVKFVRGVLGLVGVKGAGGLNAVLKVDVAKTGVLEERSWLSVTEVCWAPPTVKVLYGSEVHAEIPAYVVVNGVYKGTVVACVDTGLVRSRADFEVHSEYGYFKGSYRAEKGHARVALNWAQHWITTSGIAILEVCFNGLYVKGCVELIKLEKPGFQSREFNYSLLRKVFIGNIRGEGLEHIADLADSMPGILAPAGSVLKLSFKTGFGKKVVKEVTIT